MIPTVSCYDIEQEFNFHAVNNGSIRYVQIVKVSHLETICFSFNSLFSSLINNTATNKTV